MILSKEISDSIRNCMLSVFWRKVDVVDFLQSAGCTKDDLREIKEYETLGLTKNAIIESVLRRLKARPDEGISPIRSIIRALTEWSTFDPYYFGPGGSLDLSKAKAAIRHLKEVQVKHDARLIEDSKEQKRKMEELKVKYSLADLQKKFFQLYKGLDENGAAINLQKRGYLFEALLRDLFRLEDLNTTEQFQFNTVGEQIDGSLKYDGEHYIIEAKWQEESVASNALYQFAYKIEGKMYGRGLFISINGFSPDSVRALTQGKSLKSILIDGADLALVMEGIWPFSEMLDRKVKAAQTLGLIYTDPFSMKEKVKA